MIDFMVNQIKKSSKQSKQEFKFNYKISNPRN